jgi:DNA polymerase elongation subunit (family B)
MVNIESFNVTSGDDLEYVAGHMDEYTDEQLQSIYNIVDVHVKQESHAHFIRYNVNDVQLVVDLDAKMKLIELVCALAYGSKANFADTFRQVRLWDIMAYHYLRAEGKQIPPRKEGSKTEQYAGAFVKDPLVGLHNWVVSFDVASMYPHIIREWNLSPETIDSKATVSKWTVEEFLAKTVDTSFAPVADVALAGNGLQTRRDTEGFLPHMLKTLYEERVRYKGMMKSAKNELERIKSERARRADTRTA